jgi:hypothetical protein
MVFVAHPGQTGMRVFAAMFEKRPASKDAGYKETRYQSLFLGISPGFGTG